jgi:hypothetical protein
MAHHRLTQRLASIATLTVLLAAGAPALAQEATSPAKGPVAVFRELVQDFGDIARGDVLEHAFVVKNDGDAPLEILSAKPT